MREAKFQTHAKQNIILWFPKFGFYIFGQQTEIQKILDGMVAGIPSVQSAVYFFANVIF